MRGPRRPPLRLRGPGMSGGSLRHRTGYEHKSTNEKVVGAGTKPAAPVPYNILVRPLRSPPMEPVKDRDDDGKHPA